MEGWIEGKKDGRNRKGGYKYEYEYAYKDEY